MPARWQMDFEKAWTYRTLLFLCGNVRDLYAYQASDDSPLELLDLRELLERWSARRAQAARFYDPIDKFRTVFGPGGLSTEADPGPAAAQSGQPQPDEFAATSADPSVRGRDAGVLVDLDEIRRELALGPDRCVVVEHAGRVAHAQSSDPNNGDAVIAIEKLIESVDNGGHLVMVYLFARDIPEQLYANESRSIVIEVPHPERREVREVLGGIFGLIDGALDRGVNACHGLSLREIRQLLTGLCEPPNAPDIDELERVVRFYKFGDVTNYWDELDIGKLRATARILTQEEGIKGQDQAVEKVRNVLVRARADIQRTTGGNPGRPRGVLFFAGPTGVGKTMTAQKLAKFLFGDEDAFLRFDMSEYQQDFQVSRLYGAPPGYVGFEQGGALTSPLQANPFRVVLFDEIEKADPRVFDIFLQILGDGRLTDSKGQVAHFSECFIIFTSNLGADTAAARNLDASAENRAAVRLHYTNAVEEFFRHKIGRPELLNRIGRDNIVVFNYIASEDIAREILEHHLRTIQESFNRSYSARPDGKPSLTLDMPIAQIIEGLLALNRERIRTFGGREVENIVNDLVRDELAMLVLEAEARGLSAARIVCTMTELGEPRFAIQ